MILAILLAVAFDGITLGAPVSRTIATIGNPDVVATDVGTVWTWQRDGNTTRVTTDDDGNVRMIDLAPAKTSASALPIPIANGPQLSFNASTAPAVRQKLVAYADFSAPATLPESGTQAVLQAYRLDDAHELALLFDSGSQRLREAFYGERPTLARAGLLPALGAASPAFTAPALSKLGAGDYGTADQGVAYIRISVTPTGGVSDASIYVSSGNLTLDRIALSSARHDSFVPATLGGKPVASTFFYRENFVNTTPHR
ncbi:MAG: energy transducer TonB [Candidatus Eremiobacteraeota bacterium]|nr:energy transducer TonB [Candidatus Eremiobacteraeota bacterium]